MLDSMFLLRVLTIARLSMTRSFLFLAIFFVQVFFPPDYFPRILRTLARSERSSSSQAHRRNVYEKISFKVVMHLKFPIAFHLLSTTIICPD